MPKGRGRSSGGKKGKGGAGYKERGSKGHLGRDIGRFEDGDVDGSIRPDEDADSNESPAGYGARQKHSEDEDSLDVAQERFAVRLVIFEFGQNDPKVDSGSRMARFGLATQLRHCNVRDAHSPLRTITDRHASGGIQ